MESDKCEKTKCPSDEEVLFDDIQVQRPDYSAETDDPELLMTLALQRLDTITDDQGFMYCINRTVGEVRYLRCTKFKNGCNGRAIMRGDEVEQTSTHNHRADRRRVAVRKFTKEFILEAQERCGRPLRQIYDQVCQRYPSEAAYVSYKAAYRSLHRASLKMAQLPPISHSEATGIVKGNAWKIANSSGNKSNQASRTMESSEDLNIEDEMEVAEIKEELESDTEGNLAVSELLPGPKGQPLYYDGVGYYFNVTSEDSAQRWLQCSHSNCGIFAFMECSDGAPITLLEDGHNHPPNSHRRERICFLHRIKTRHSQEDTPFVTIFNEEANKNPVGASFFSIETIEEHLKKKTNQSHAQNELGPTRTAEKKKLFSTHTEEDCERKRRKVTDTPKKSAVKLEIVTPPKRPEVVSVQKRSEKLQGPEYFTDLKGHFYYCNRILDGLRCLRCLVPTCPAEAGMELTDNAEIQLLPSSRPHNHQPDTSTNYNDKIKEVEDLWQEQQTSERLPSLRVQYCCYHDGRGYYYHQANQADNIRYLVCVERLCSARAHMCSLKDAPISMSPLHPGHNHPPDLTLREALLFVDNVRVQARSDGNIVTAIDSETARNIMGASRVDLTLLQELLEKGSQVSKNSCDDKMTEDEVDWMSCVKPAPRSPEWNHAGSLPSEVSDCLSAKQWERVPALFGQDWLYHDLIGHYYRVHNSRQLMCVEPKCGVKVPLPGSVKDPIHPRRPHSHNPRPQRYRSRLWFIHRVRLKARQETHLTFSQLYHMEADRDPEAAKLVSEQEVQRLVDQAPSSFQEEENPTNEESQVPSEILPCPDLNKSQYHDGNGYYYIVDKRQNNNEFVNLRCVWWPRCGGLGKMAGLNGAVITTTASHNHSPDLAHRHLCQFTHTLKQRARDEATPLSLIYEEESKKYPEAAAALDKSQVMSKLVNIRTVLKQRLDIPTEGTETDKDEISTDQEGWQEAASETVAGPRQPIYYDGNGHYFKETFSTDSLRYLICVEPDCVAQAKMVPVDGAPVVPQVGSEHHNHSPDPWRLTALQLLASLRDSVRDQPQSTVDTIYNQLVDSEPILAAQLNKENVLKMMNGIQVVSEKEKGEQSCEEETADQVEEAGLWDGTEPAQRVPSDKHQTWLIHDGRGYYYYSRPTHSREWLVCCEEGCSARAWLDPESGAVVRRAPGCVLHNHLPDPSHTPPQAFIQTQPLREKGVSTTDLEVNTHAVDNYFKDPSSMDGMYDDYLANSLNEDDLLEMTLEPCEVLHSAGSGETVYSDGRGFYYSHSRSIQDKTLVFCVMPFCQARAHLLLSQIRVPPLTGHSHPPNMLYRHKLVFLHSLRCRIMAGETDVTTIYNEEADREPIGADMLDEVAVKNLMYKLIKVKQAQEVPLDIIEPEWNEETFEESTDEFAADDGDSCQITNVIGNVQLLNDYWESDEGNVDTEEMSTKLPRSEKLPSRSNNVLYHNGEGYYFHFNTVKERNMYLRCAEPQCKVRAWKPVTPEDAPILLTRDSPVHNHRPDLSRRSQLLLMHRCKLRAATETRPLQEIWDSEANRDPDTAALVSEANVKSQMKRYRQEHGSFRTNGNNLEANPEEGIHQDPSVVEFLSDKNCKSSAVGLLDIHRGEVPEKIPSPSNETLWHAAGYFYTVYHIVGHLYKAKCIENGCSARSQIQVVPGEAATIRLNRNTVHNHPADTHRRAQLLFIDRCKRRAAETFETIHDIYSDETSREPEVAAMLSTARVKQAMMVAKKAHMKKFNYQIEDIMEEDIDDEGEILSENSLEVIKKEGGEEGSSQGLSECLLSQPDGTLVFHDLQGYFYWETSLQANYRLLKCIDCEVQAKMATSPLDAAIVLVDSSTRHNHDPDMSRMGRIVRGQVPVSGAAKGKSKPKLTKVEPSEDTMESNETMDPADENYTDYVTLDDENENNKGGEDVDDPDFKPSMSKSDERNQKMFHDGNGYYYTLYKIKNHRYLQCSAAECGVVVALGPLEKPLTKLFNTSPKHRHPPDLSCRRRNQFLKKAANRTSFDDSVESRDQDTEDEDVVGEGKSKNNIPSELVRGKQPNTFNYHDGHGYYYKSLMTTSRHRYLLCVVKTCKARGFMLLRPDNAPINLTDESPQHNHSPDVGHKKFTHFLEKCEMRSLEEDTPVRLIYDQEAKLDPVFANKILKENVLQRMLKIRSGKTGTNTMPNSEVPHAPSDNTTTDKSTVDELMEYVVKPAGSTCQDLTQEADKDTNGNQTQEPLKSEVMPGFRPNSTIYHDGRGYYFIFNAFKNNKRYLRCIEPRCRVRGSMEPEDGAPIHTSPGSIHNHRPDFRRKNFVLFLQRCKERAMVESKPVQEIYNEEAASDPVSAKMISHHNLIQRMLRARKLNLTYVPTQQDHSEFVEACQSGDFGDDNSSSQDEAYLNIVAEAIIEEPPVIEEDMEAEAIEKAISELANLPTDTSTEGEVVAEAEGEPVPSEVLPGIRPHSSMYYDSRGYYYIFNSQRENIWYLKCIEPQCRVRAHMEPREGSPIMLSPNSLHNHRPDFKRKQFVLWMEETKRRAVNETLPIPNIYAQQAARDPVSASLISKENMKTRMYRARKASLQHMQQTTEPKIAGTEKEDTVFLYQPTNSQPTNRPTFCDDKGYCYQQTTIRQHVRYLKCIEPGCKARGSTSLDPNTSVTLNRLTPAHNHPPSETEFAMLVDSSDLDPSQLDTPIQVIYTDENGGERIAVCQISEEPQSSPPTKRPYRQRQKPDLTIDPEEIIDSSATSDVDVAAGDYYHNEDQQRFPLKPSEVIPGLRPDANNYHDGNGFYYELNRLSQNIRYLKCLIKDCKARAYMEVGKKNAPIIQTNFAKHNHGPDLFRKQFTVFLHRVTRRAASEDTPIHVIYDQEAARDPQSASQIRMENVKQRMLRFRKKHRQQRNAFHEVQQVDIASNEEPTLYQLAECSEEGLEYPEGGTYYILEEEEVDMVEGEVEGNTSHYESYVISEVEVESSTQQH